MRHNPMYMADYVEHLEKVLKTTSEKVLQGSGTISHVQAIEKSKGRIQEISEQNFMPWWKRNIWKALKKHS